MSGWEALAQLRARGRFPRLVIVTDDPKMPLRGGPVLVVEHPGKQPLPLHLLEDLDVIFWFQQCRFAGRVAAAAREAGVKFDRARCYCRCACAVNVAPYDCDDFPAVIEWLPCVT